MINFLPAGIFQKVLSSSNIVIHLFPVTCKSKLCPSCGYRYSMTWTENIQKHILNIEHRHVIFTIPKECRESSPFMIDLFYQNFLPLLIRYSSSQHQQEKNFLNIPNITLLIPILYITVSFLSFILLADTWNGTLIYFIRRIQ